MPTDRLHAEWWMNSTRVEEALSGKLPVTEVKETIRIPVEIAKWKKSSDLTQALAVQSKVREQFQSAFAHGMAAIGFEQDVEGNGIFQLGIAEVDIPHTGPTSLR
jgi:predicted GNAT superfamily acetyltransferase